MKKLKTMVLVSAVTIGMISCKKEVTGEGPQVTQPRAVDNFTAIELRMAGDVYYKNDNTQSVAITAQQNVLDILETYVADNKLVIKFSGNYDYHSSSAIRINVSAPGVNSFGLTTAGSIYCTNELHPSSLFLSVKGSGNLSLQHVVTGSIEAVNNGSGNITAASGTAQNENLHTTGSGRIDLMGIAAGTVTAKTSGSGSIKVKPTNQLNATVNGSGSIYFTGNPNVSSHISGSGHLVHF